MGPYKRMGAWVYLAMGDSVLGRDEVKFLTRFQTCVCANRFFVHEKVYDAFIAALQTAMTDLKVGDGLQEGTTQGPLINEKALQKVGLCFRIFMKSLILNQYVIFHM